MTNTAAKSVDIHRRKPWTLPRKRPNSSTPRRFHKALNYSLAPVSIGGVDRTLAIAVVFETAYDANSSMKQGKSTDQAIAERTEMVLGRPTSIGSPIWRRHGKR